MAVTRKYSGEDRYYPYLALADGTVGWEATDGATVEIATAEDVPDDGRFDVARAKTTRDEGDKA